MDLNDIEVPADLLDQIISANPFDFAFPSNGPDEPHLEILLQPKTRGYRFRYTSEGNTHGGIPAESTEKGNKKFPTVHIANYKGKAAIYVTIVSIDDPPTVHPHNLVGKDIKGGILICEHECMAGNWVKSFPNIGIQHVTKKDLVRVLHEKLCQNYQLAEMTSNESQSFDICQLVGSFGGNDTAMIDESVARAVAAEENTRLQKEAQELSKKIDLSAVRLCFQAYLPDEVGNLVRPLPAVLSNPIHDQKAAHAGQLRICRISKSSSSVNGGEEVFLLCDKVQKDKIKIRFYQEDGSGNLTFEGFGKFQPSDVHKQCAIVFTTPPYVDKAIQKPVDVWMQLKRELDDQCSEPVKFIYRPEEYDRYKIGEKRRKGLPVNLEEMLAQQTKQGTSTSTASSATLDLSNLRPSNGGQYDLANIRFFKQ